MFKIEFGNLSFNVESSEQQLCIVIDSKNESDSIQDFICKVLNYLEEDGEFFEEATQYKKCVFTDALDRDIRWLDDIIKGMNRKVEIFIEEPVKILTGKLTVFDNAWVIETKDLYYYIYWITTA